MRTYLDALDFLLSTAFGLKIDLIFLKNTAKLLSRATYGRTVFRIREGKGQQCMTFSALYLDFESFLVNTKLRHNKEFIGKPDVNNWFEIKRKRIV